MALEFEWDAAKSRRNATKHGVTFEEGLTVFRDPLARIFDDPEHSGAERRELMIGQSAAERLLVMAFTERGRRIRLVSARPATRRERKDYEQGTH
jgi:uncharacterized DUF497 family protein